MAISNAIESSPAPTAPKIVPPDRRAESGRVYLITIFTEHRAHLFDELLLARMLVRHLREQEFAITLAYVIMPDHVYWLVRVKRRSTLAAVVRNAKASSTRSINGFYGRSGRVWQAGFQKYPLQENDDLKYIARYIISNPIRAGLAKSVRDYSHWDAVWL